MLPLFFFYFHFGKLDMAAIQHPNKRKYQCDDCGERRFVARHELYRRSKPYCYGCGCTRLTIVSLAARDDEVRFMDCLRQNGYKPVG